MFRRMEVIGYVVSDSIVNLNFNGNRIPVNFKVAVNERRGDKEKSFFIPCVIWAEKENAINFGERIKKGGLIYLEGLPEANLWKNKAGESVAEIKIDVKDFRNLSKKDSTDVTQENKQ